MIKPGISGGFYHSFNAALAKTAGDNNALRVSQTGIDIIHFFQLSAGIQVSFNSRSWKRAACFNASRTE